MAKDPKPENGRTTAARPVGGPARAGRRAAPGQVGKGRTRPPANVVTQQKPWGLIAAAVAVVVFAAAVITYAVVQVNKSNADKVTVGRPDRRPADLRLRQRAEHVTTPVDLHGDARRSAARTTRSGPTAPAPSTTSTSGTRTPCTRLEHGAIWITYDPDTISDADLTTLEDLVDGALRPAAVPLRRPGLDDQPAVLEPPAVGRLGHRQAGEAVRRLHDLQRGLLPRGRRQLREPDLHQHPLVVGDPSRGRRLRPPPTRRRRPPRRPRPPTAP